MGKLIRSYLYQTIGELYRWSITTLEKIIVVGQILKLLADRFGNFWLTVTQAAAPESRHGVQQFIAVCILNINVLSMVDNSAGLFCIVAKIGKGVQVTMCV